MEFDNTSEAIVWAGARINQDAAFRNTNTNPHPNNADQQVVSVEATTTMQTLNVTGVFDFKQKPKGTGTNVKPSASGNDKGGVGGAILVSLLNNNTKALVEDGVSVYTGSSGAFNVKAEEAILNFNFSQAGASAGDYGIGGTVAYVEQRSHTHAQLSGGAVVKGGTATNENDAPGSPVSVTANSLETSINWSGAVAKGSNVGMGITVAINDIDRDTQAIIGTLDPAIDAATGVAPSTATNINASGDLKVDAKNDGALWAFTVAAAVGGGSPPPNSSTQGEAPIGDKDGKKAKYGIGISASVSINSIEDNVYAYIHDAGTIQAPNIEIAGLNETDLTAWAAAASVVLPTTGSGGNTNSASIAGSFSKNELEGNTKATIKGENAAGTKLTLKPAGKLLVSADRKGKLQAITAGLGVSTQKGGNSLVVAGSVSLNEIANTTEALIDGIQDDVANAAAPDYQLFVNAKDASEIFALAGSLSIGLGGGNLGVGFSFGKNTITNNTIAAVNDSNLSHVAAATVSAMNSADIHSITITGALAAGDGNQIAIAGSLAFNEISGMAAAHVSGGSSIVSAGDVIVSADDVSTIVADGGGVAIAAALSRQPSSSGSGAIGFALGFNEIQNGTRAYVDGSTVTASNVRITSGSTSAIDAFSLAVAGGAAVGKGTTGVFSAAGAGAENKINNTVEAYVKDSTAAHSARAAGEVVVRAEDNAHIHVDVVGASVSVAATGAGNAGAVSIGVSIARNEVDNQIRGYIENSTVVTNTGDVDVSAHSFGQKLFDLATAGSSLVTASELDDAAAQDKDDPETTPNEKTTDEAGDAAIIANLRAQFAANGKPLSEEVRVATLIDGEGWVVVDEGDNRTYAISKNASDVLEVSKTTIEALAVAASAAVGAGSSNGVGLSGAGAEATNVILTDTNAYVSNSTYAEHPGRRTDANGQRRGARPSDGQSS